jgi:hypothetical protein
VFEEMPEEVNPILLNWLRGGSATDGRNLDRVAAGA